MWHNVTTRGNTWHRLAFDEALSKQNHVTERDHEWHSSTFDEALGATDNTVIQCGAA